MRLKTNFKNYEKALKVVIRNAKSCYYCSEFSNARNDMKKTWKTIKNVLSKNKKSPNFPGKFFHQNEVIIGKENIANKFNEFFATIGTKLSDQVSCNDNDISIDFFSQ